MFKEKHVLLPTLFLILLLLAGLLRWETETSKTLEKGAVNWRKDRWTGQIWLKGYHAEGTGEKPIGEKFEIPSEPRRPGTVFDRFLLASPDDEDPWGRIGLAKYGPPSDEDMLDYLSRVNPSDKETWAYRMTVEYFAAVEAWKQEVKQVEKNKEDAWFFRNTLGKAWVVLLSVSGLWVIISVRKSKENK